VEQGAIPWRRLSLLASEIRKADSRRSIQPAAGQIPEGGGFAAAKSIDDGPAGPAPL
jgi:hypothetical protein